uniref:Uncharacterized protein n=1 Tax=Molossus molossus TaxID=27622 RepID=A0A7J8HC56_MOLMO|nr:hypothetical protein HJG59_011205 [Molossus molossus]
MVFSHTYTVSVTFLVVFLVLTSILPACAVTEHRWRPSMLCLCPFELFIGSPLLTGFSPNSDLAPKVYQSCPNLLFQIYLQALPPNNSQLPPVLLGLGLAHKYPLGITMYECLLPLVPLTEIVPSSFPASANQAPFSEIQLTNNPPNPMQGTLLCTSNPGFCDLSLTTNFSCVPLNLVICAVG